jgi:ribose-phosphate pyrophosphokinase
VPDSQLMVFTGNANPDLAAEIAAPEPPLGKAVVGQFSDGEVMTEIQENVRGATSSWCSRPARRPTTT